MKGKRYLSLGILLLLAMLISLGCETSEPADTPTPEIVAEAESSTEEPVVEPTEILPPTATDLPPTETATLPPSTPEPTETPVPPTFTPEPPPAWAADMVGTWFKVGMEISGQKLPDYYIRYTDDGIVWVDESQYKLEPDSGAEVEAQYWFEGDLLVISGQSGRSACPPDQLGRYQVDLIAGESIRLVELDDPCRPRKTHNEGTWTWVSEEPEAAMEPPPTWAADLIGIWFKEGATINNQKLPDYYVQYFADGFLRVDESRFKLEDADAVEAGADFWFEGDVLLVADSIGRSACSADQIGRYQVEVVPGESLRVVVLDDPCRARVTHNEGTWTWVPTE